MKNNDNNERKRPLNRAIDAILIGSTLAVFFGTGFNKDGTLKIYLGKPSGKMESSLEINSIEPEVIKLSKESYLNNMSFKEHYVIDYDDIKKKSISNRLNTPQDLTQKNLSNVEKIVIYGAGKDYEENGNYTKQIPEVYPSRKE